MKRLVPLAVIILLAADVFRVQVRIDELRKVLPAGYEILYLPSGKYLQTIAMGYPCVLSDLIYLWSIQYTTNPDDPDRFTRVDQIYRVINDLDPQYVDPYQIGAMTMVYEMGDLQMAFRLLDRGIERVRNNWSIPMDAGFYAYMTAKNYPLAIHYFDIALSRPGAPSVIARLRADMYQRKGDEATARDFWGEIYRTSTDEHDKRVAYNHYFDLTQVVDLTKLQRAINTYNTVNGHYPARLARLVDEGFVKEIPTNLDGEQYRYDPRTGKVSPPSPFKLNREYR